MPPAVHVSAADCAHRGAGATHTRALLGALVITAAFMVAELVGGWIANSLALLADAGHMLGDAASLGLALFAARMARRPASATRTYGYLRLEIIATVVNGVVLVVIAGGVVWEALARVADPPEVQAGVMLVVAVAGLAANLAAMRTLHGGHRHSLNVRGAYLHVLGDLLGSVGTIGAAVVIAATGWRAADPVISVVIALLILGGAWRLLRESVDVLLEATPRHIALEDVERHITTIAGVSDVHDLHVWTVTSGVVAMTGHAVIADPARSQAVLETLGPRMASLGIHHVTMQLEAERMCG